MELSEDQAIANGDLPWYDCAEHLRLRRDEGGNVHQPGSLEIAMRAAIAEIESQTGRYMLPRRMFLSATRLPVQLRIHQEDRPAVTEVLRDDVVVSASAFTWRFEQGRALLATNEQPNGAWQILLTVGRDWAELPTDLRVAVQILTAAYYASNEGDHTLPKAGIAHLLAKYRPIRLGRGC